VGVPAVVVGDVTGGVAVVAVSEEPPSSPR